MVSLDPVHASLSRAEFPEEASPLPCIRPRPASQSFSSNSPGWKRVHCPREHAAKDLGENPWINGHPPWHKRLRLFLSNSRSKIGEQLIPSSRFHALSFVSFFILFYFFFIFFHLHVLQPTPSPIYTFTVYNFFEDSSFQKNKPSPSIHVHLRSNH